MGIEFIQGFGRVGARITGMDRLDRALNQLKRANSENDRVLRLIGIKMKNAIKSNFERKENLDGTPWEPLSEATISMRKQSKSSKGRAPIILRDTNRLYNSIAFQVVNDEVYAGTNVDYGARHHFGVSEGGPDLPVREFLYVRQKDIEELTNFLTMELVVSALTR